MNTDPWVFFPGFVWSICRHKRLPALVQAGDIVLFGSAVGNEWVLDTVFVVKDRGSQVRVGEFGVAYDRLVLPVLPTAFQPFVGQEFPTSAERFSFVPAARADDGNRPFARPSMNALFSRLSKDDGQAPSPDNAQALVACTPAGGIRAFWDALVQQVEAAGLVLATLIYHPSTEDQLPPPGSAPPPGAASPACDSAPPSCAQPACEEPE